MWLGSLVLSISTLSRTQNISSTKRIVAVPNECIRHFSLWPTISKPLHYLKTACCKKIFKKIFIFDRNNATVSVSEVVGNTRPQPQTQGTMQSKYWCFTEHYAADDQVQMPALLNTFKDEEKVSYYIIGKETCPTTGRKHLQGYFEWVSSIRFTTLKLVLPKEIHLERRIGSAEQNRAYCSKEGDFFEVGSISNPSPGKRNDLLALHNSLKSGASLTTISDEHFPSFIRYPKAIQAWMMLHSPPRNWVPEVIVIWGVTGSGKTRKCFEADPTLWTWPGGGLWFDGYQGEDTVLFDDFRGSDFKVGYLLRLLDRYPMKVPIKGGFVNWKPRKIYITSNLAPSEWYPGAAVRSQEALMRRLTSIEELN